MSGRTYGRTLLGGVLLSGALALPGAAQEMDARWSAFIGCWVPTGSEQPGLLCFRPAGAGVEMFNVVEGEVTASEPLIADGVARPVAAEGCTGTERVEFAEDGMRAFTHSEFQCAGEVRSGSGVMAFINAAQWIDVRSLSVGGDPVAWAQAYEAAAPSALAAQGVVEDPAAANSDLVRAARIRAARDIDIADVEEAARRVDARAVEVWVAARESEFDLTGSEIVRLADAGLPESIIDVMVAVSYPDRFVVSPEGAASEAERLAYADQYPDGYRRGYGSYLFNPFRDPSGFRYSPLYSRFGAYGYDGFGGGLYGGYGGYWGYVPATIIVQPANPTPEPRSRMVPGRGYTRDTSSSGSSGGSGGQPASSSGSGGGGSSSGSGGSSSSGGGSSSSGRTAQPRPN